jgi:hypothetical protein
VFQPRSLIQGDFTGALDDDDEFLHPLSYLRPFSTASYKLATAEETLWRRKSAKSLWVREGLNREPVYASLRALPSSSVLILPAACLNGAKRIGKKILELSHPLFCVFSACVFG